MLARPLLLALAGQRGAESIRAAAPEALLGLLAGDQLFGASDPWPARGADRSQALAHVKAWGPGTALVLPPSFSSALDAWRSGARVRIGFAGEWRSPLLTISRRRPARGALHLSEEYLALGESLGAVATPWRPLPVSEAARASAAALLRERGLQDSPVAVLGPGAIYGPAKRWDRERFAELGRRLSSRGLAIAVCGTAAERDACDAVATRIAERGAERSRAVSLAGATPLQTLAGLCAKAAVAVCNDSGLAHLAAAVGTHTVVIFGSTSSAWTAPLGSSVRIVQHAPVCSPCFQRDCRIGTPCLAAVGVDEVEAACRAGAA